MPDPEELSIEEAVALVADWIAPARRVFQLGQPAHLTFSPGDGTAYAMSFVPPTGIWIGTEREYPRIPDGSGLLVLPIYGRACPMNPEGAPSPEYVAEKLKLTNPPALLAVGICWWLMAGGDPEEGAAMWGGWLRGLGRKGEGLLSEWRRDWIRPSSAASLRPID